MYGVIKISISLVSLLLACQYLLISPYFHLQLDRHFISLPNSSHILPGVGSRQNQASTNFFEADLQADTENCNTPKSRAKPNLTKPEASRMVDNDTSSNHQYFTMTVSEHLNSIWFCYECNMLLWRYLSFIKYWSLHLMTDDVMALWCKMDLINSLFKFYFARNGIANPEVVEHLIIIL